MLCCSSCRTCAACASPTRLGVAACAQRTHDGCHTNLPKIVSANFDSNVFKFIFVHNVLLLCGTISFVPVNKAAQNKPNHVGVTLWGSFGQQATTDISGSRNPVQNHQGLHPGCKLVGSISKHKYTGMAVVCFVELSTFSATGFGSFGPNKGNLSIPIQNMKKVRLATSFLL